jgi:hypothetical protein
MLHIWVLWLRYASDRLTHTSANTLISVVLQDISYLDGLFHLYYYGDCINTAVYL